MSQAVTFRCGVLHDACPTESVHEDSGDDDNLFHCIFRLDQPSILIVIMILPCG